MASGSSVVSQSIMANANKAAAKTHQAPAVGVTPQRATHRANRAAVANSTSGYWRLMGA
jgi:hypothetical protein